MTIIKKEREREKEREWKKERDLEEKNEEKRHKNLSSLDTCKQAVFNDARYVFSLPRPSDHASSLTNDQENANQTTQLG